MALRQGLAKAEPDRADYQRDLSVSYNCLAAIAQAEGDGRATLRYLESDLGIAELLAQREPERADYSDDVAISHLQLGRLLQTLHDDQDAAGHLDRARQIWEQLEATGRLPPERRAILEQLRG
ncbi:MAG: hypothetical protein AB1Z98_30270 [Nannocystaceae bacterium]